MGHPSQKSNTQTTAIYNTATLRGNILRWPRSNCSKSATLQGNIPDESGGRQKVPVNIGQGPQRVVRGGNLRLLGRRRQPTYNLTASCKKPKPRVPIATNARFTRTRGMYWGPYPIIRIYLYYLSYKSNAKSPMQPTILIQDPVTRLSSAPFIIYMWAGYEGADDYECK